jgi:hypothetical protein
MSEESVEQPAAAATVETTAPAGAVSVSETPVAQVAQVAPVAEGKGTLLGALAPATAAATDAPVAVTAAAWPDDWRTQLAGEDKDFLKTLDRFTDPAALAKSYRELRARMSSGEGPKPLPENATPEQKAEWRKENGLPEKWEDYKIELPGGQVIGDADKPLVNDFTKFAHETNMPPAAVNAALAWWFQKQDAVNIQRAQQDEAFLDANMEKVKAAWGPALVERNAIGIKTWLDGQPEELKLMFAEARMPDGRKLGAIPEIMNVALRLAQDDNPELFRAMTPAGNSSGMGSSDEIKLIEDKMRTDRAGYYKDQALQDRLRYLYDQRDRNNKSSQAA